SHDTLAFPFRTPTITMRSSSLASVVIVTSPLSDFAYGFHVHRIDIFDNKDPLTELGLEDLEAIAGAEAAIRWPARRSRWATSPPGMRKRPTTRLDPALAVIAIPFSLTGSEAFAKRSLADCSYNRSGND